MKSFTRLLFRQSLMEFRKRNLGTFLGGVWAIFSPLINLSLIYFVFKYGLKSGVIGEISFINWFVPGMLAWTFMSESITLSCSTIVDNSYLVTKMRFPVHVLPSSTVLASLPIHLFLMSLLLVLLIVDNVGSFLTWVQLIYYLLCSIILCVILSFIVSTFMIFVKDTARIVAVFVQVFFWATPIFWDPAQVAGTRFSWLLFSPFNYILQGYRDSLFFGIWFWDRPSHTLVFWISMSCSGFFAFWIFRKMRPHFADVL